MSHWPPMKFKHDYNPILTAPDVDIEEYSKLRKKPYALQSCTNLPYYFLEPETPGPKICSSDLDQLPMHKFNQSHADKLKRMYVCLREECGFKRYLVGEKRILGYNDELIRVYDCEISGSNFRIQHIKADIVQFMDYIRKIYNLNNDKFNSATEAAFAAALASSNLANCIGFAANAIASGANIYLFLWMCVFEFFVVRVQTYFHLTLANYANGTGFSAWSFCRYIRGMGATLLIIEFFAGLIYFFEAPLCFVKAWVAKQSDEELNLCQPTISIDETIGSYSLQKTDYLEDCFSEATDATATMRCNRDPLGNTINVFPSNYFYHMVIETADLSPYDLRVTKSLAYIITFILWFFLTRRIKNGFNKMLQMMHYCVSVTFIFIVIIFILVAQSMNENVSKEATYAFFSLQSNIFNVKVVLSAFRHSTKLLVPYLLEFGSTMPFHWYPETVFSVRAAIHLTLHFIGMWLAYLAVYNEKYVYRTPDISCFIQKDYILHSALPRLLNQVGIKKTMATIYYLIDGFTYFILMSTMFCLVWRNLKHHVGWFKKYPQVIHVYNLFCLATVVLLMFNIKVYHDHTNVLGKFKFLESVVLSVLVICIDIAIVTYYGPSRLWGDLEYLTRRRVRNKIENSVVLTVIILVLVSIVGLPRMLKTFLSVKSEYQLIIGAVLVAPSMINLLLIIISDTETTEVRNFHFWGERSYKNQYERFRFNSSQFRTEYLRARKITMLDSGDEFYFKQRQKALLRIAKALKQSHQ